MYKVDYKFIRLTNTLRLGFGRPVGLKLFGGLKVLFLDGFGGT